MANGANHGATSTAADDMERRRWIGLLARTPRQFLVDALLELKPEPVFTRQRVPEIGLAMVRGRAGGDGAPFNLGEMTITRCVLATEDSVTGEALIGISCVAGRDPEHAEAAAKLDALFRDSRWGAHLRERVLAPLTAAERASCADRAARTAATKVEFFTMERGH